MNINLTLIGQLITFAVFVWFTMKFVWPPIVAALEERKKKIADGLAAAERGQHEQELAQKRATEEIAKAKQQASEIVSKANKQATEIVEEAKSAAKEEGGRLVAAAQAEIDQEVSKAREDLRGKVVELAVAGASKILEREIDVDAHKDVVDKVASGL